MSKRTMFEIGICTVIFLFAVISFWPSLQKKGHYTLDDKQIVYDGYLFKNKFAGKGKLVIEKDTYQGTFKDGRFDGQGTFTSHDGWTYSGGFKEGAPEGKGVLTTQNGSVYKGTFKDGAYQK